MRSTMLLVFAITIARPASAGRIWNCAQNLFPEPARGVIGLEVAKLESWPVFFLLKQKLRASRRRHGIKSIRTLDWLQPGQIAIVTATNCGPSIDSSLRFNVLSNRYPAWKFRAHDFKADFHSDDGQIPSVLVVGCSRRVQFFIGGFGEPVAYTRGRLEDAIRLAAVPGPDLIWAVHVPRAGRWIEARTNPNRDTFSEMEF